MAETSQQSAVAQSRTQPFWDAWLATMQTGLPGTGLYAQPVALGRTLVDSALNAQAQWLHQSLRSLAAATAPGMDTPTSQWLETVDHNVTRWIEFRRYAWTLYFNLLENQCPSDETMRELGPAESLFQHWQDTSREITEAWIAALTTAESTGSIGRADRRNGSAQSRAA